MFRGKSYFEDGYIKNEPIVDQIESWAKNNNIVLELGWKVDLSREILNRSEKYFETIGPDTEKMWMKLFDKLSEE